MDISIIIEKLVEYNFFVWVCLYLHYNQCCLIPGLYETKMFRRSTEHFA